MVARTYAKNISPCDILFLYERCPSSHDISRQKLERGTHNNKVWLRILALDIFAEILGWNDEMASKQRDYEQEKGIW